MNENNLDINNVIDQILSSAEIEIDQSEIHETRELIQQQLERAVWETVLIDLDENQVKQLGEIFNNPQGDDDFEDKIAEITAEIPGLSEKIQSRISQEIDTITELLKQSQSKE